MIFLFYCSSRIEVNLQTFYRGFKVISKKKKLRATIMVESFEAMKNQKPFYELIQYILRSMENFNFVFKITRRVMEPSTLFHFKL